MKTENIINQINAGIHIILENTKQSIIVDILQYYGKDIPFDKMMEIISKHFDEADKAIDE